MSVEEADELVRSLSACVADAKKGEYSSYGEVLHEAVERSEIEDAKAVLRKAGEIV
jgi:hypothetical protein